MGEYSFEEGRLQLSGEVVPIVAFAGAPDDPWFKARPVHNFLGTGNISHTLERVRACDRSALKDLVAAKGPPTFNSATIVWEDINEGKAIYANETGLYSIILGSRKPIAQEFQRWVTSVVLVSIRRTGSYGAPMVLANDAWDSAFRLSGGDVERALALTRQISEAKKAQEEAKKAFEETRMATAIADGETARQAMETAELEKQLKLRTDAERVRLAEVSKQEAARTGQEQAKQASEVARAGQEDIKKKEMAERLRTARAEGRLRRLEMSSEAAEKREQQKQKRRRVAPPAGLRQLQLPLKQRPAAA